MKAVTAAEAQVFCLAPFGTDASMYEQPVVESENAVEAYLGYEVGPDSPAPIKLAILMMVNGREFGFVKPWLNPYVENK